MGRFWSPALILLISFWVGSTFAARIELTPELLSEEASRTDTRVSWALRYLAARNLDCLDIERGIYADRNYLEAGLFIPQNVDRMIRSMVAVELNAFMDSSHTLLAHTRMEDSTNVQTQFEEAWNVNANSDVVKRLDPFQLLRKEKTDRCRALRHEIETQVTRVIQEHRWIDLPIGFYEHGKDQISWALNLIAHSPESVSQGATLVSGLFLGDDVAWDQVRRTTDQAIDWTQQSAKTVTTSIGEFKADPKRTVLNLGNAFVAMPTRQVGGLTLDGVEILFTGKAMAWGAAKLRPFFVAMAERSTLLARLEAVLRENSILRRAIHIDPLTKVFNRAALLSEDIRNTIQSWNAYAVIYMDGNNFKVINDVLGHTVGDRTIAFYATTARNIARIENPVLWDETISLQARVARNVAAAVREGDFVFRMGGEEFAIVVPYTAESGLTIEEFAQRVAQRVYGEVEHSGFKKILGREIERRKLALTQAELASAYRTSGVIPQSEHVGGLSVGWSTSESGKTIEQIIEAAEENCRAAKGQFRNSIHQVAADPNLHPRP